MCVSVCLCVCVCECMQACMCWFWYLAVPGYQHAQYQFHLAHMNKFSCYCYYHLHQQFLVSLAQFSPFTLWNTNTRQNMANISYYYTNYTIRSRLQRGNGASCVSMILIRDEWPPCYSLPCKGFSVNAYTCKKRMETKRSIPFHVISIKQLCVWANALCQLILTIKTGTRRMALFHSVY